MASLSTRTNRRGLHLQSTSGGGTSVRLDHEGLGGFIAVEGGGFLPYNCRKPCATKAEAVRKVLTTAAARLRAQADRIDRAIRDELGGIE